MPGTACPHTVWIMVLVVKQQVGEQMLVSIMLSGCTGLDSLISTTNTAKNVADAMHVSL